MPEIVIPDLSHSLCLEQFRKTLCDVVGLDQIANLIDTYILKIFNLRARNGVRIEGNTVTQNGEPLFKIHRRHAARKTQGCYEGLRLRMGWRSSRRSGGG